MSIFSSNSVHSKTRIVLNTSQALLPRFKKFLLFLGLGFIFFGELSAQSVIVYDFKTGAFSAPIPYDEIITFKLIHIPGIPETISFECFEKGKLDDDSSGVSVLKRIIKKVEIRPDSSAAFVSTTYFKPNRDYIFTILAKSNPRGLNELEKQKLLKAFVEDRIISQAMVQLHQKTFYNFEEDKRDFNYVEELQKVLDAQSLALAQQVLDREVTFESPIEERIKSAQQFGAYASDLFNLFASIKTVASLDTPTVSTENKSFLNGQLVTLKEKLFNFSAWPKSAEETDSLTKFINNLVDYGVTESNEVLKYYISSLKTNWDKFMATAKTLDKDFATSKVLNAIVSDMLLAQISNPSYPKALKEQASGYFAIDFGMGYVPSTDQFVTFTQASFYFRPIKRYVPLRMYAGWDQVWSRLSIDFGLTINSIAMEDEMRGFSFDKTKDASSALMIGVGIRVLSFAKVNAGTMIYQRKDLGSPDTDYRYTGSFYIGVSIDLALKGIVSENFGPKTTPPTE